MPDRSDGYQIPSWPKTLIDRPLWNAAMGDIDARLTAREQLEASFERLMAEGVQASLDYIQVNVAPQIATLQQSISLAQEQIDQIIVGGTAPNALKLGGKDAAWYASAQAVQNAMQDASEAVDTKLADYLRADQKNVADGVAPLGPDSKVPQANLPALTTTATVGAAVAGANGKSTPDDGDFFAGVAAGSSAMFKTTWGNIKAALTTLFDGRYLKLVGGALTGNLTIQKTFPLIEYRGTGTDKWWTYHDTGNAYFTVSYNEAPKFQVTPGGAVWTAQFGDLNSKIEERSQAWANNRVAAMAVRLTGRGELNFRGLGEFEGPSGTVITGYHSINSGGTVIVGLFYRYLQMYDPVRGWTSSWYD